MADDHRSKAEDLLPASRNFTITLAERVRAQEGLPAHLYRRGVIEQLIEKMLTELRACEDPRKHAAQLDLGRVNDLIDKHNRYYPIEANLAIDPESGGVRDFRPLELVTPEWLLLQIGEG